MFTAKLYKCTNLWVYGNSTRKNPLSVATLCQLFETSGYPPSNTRVGGGEIDPTSYFSILVWKSKSNFFLQAIYFYVLHCTEEPFGSSVSENLWYTHKDRHTQILLLLHKAFSPRKLGSWSPSLGQHIFGSPVSGSWPDKYT